MSAVSPNLINTTQITGDTKLGNDASSESEETVSIRNIQFVDNAENLGTRVEVEGNFRYSENYM